MSWTDYNQYQFNQSINTGSTTPLSSISSVNINQKNSNNNNLVQELNSKLISSAFINYTGANINSLNSSAPSSTVSSVSSDSASEQHNHQQQQQEYNNTTMSTQIDNYFANEEHVSSNFWNINPSSSATAHQYNNLVENYLYKNSNLTPKAVEDQYRNNTVEEENFLQNQISQSQNQELWTNTHYQPNNLTTTANNQVSNSSSLNHSSSDQSLFDLMKYGGHTGSYTHLSSNQTIPNTMNPNNNNTQFNGNSTTAATTNTTTTTTFNNNNTTSNGVSYTASTTPLPSTPLTNTSPEQMVFQTSQFPQFQQQQQILPQQEVAPSYHEQPLNNTHNLLQNYQQQQVYLEQLQQQHQQLLQNPLFIQQQAQLVSQQLQQLQLQLQLQKQQLESNNPQVVNLQNGTNGTSTSSDLKLPLTEENLIKLQQSPKNNNLISSQSQAQAPPPALSSTSSSSEQQQQQQQQPGAAEPSITNSSGAGDNKISVNTELYKTELCSTYSKTGSCPYGNKCQFAHGGNELKIVNRGSKYRSKPCANWTKTGTCRYGSRCCFKHGN